MKYPDFPFDEVVAECGKLLADPRTTFHQKFTCTQCGSRQTIGEPNKLFALGLCEECGSTTNIRAQGCNYMLIVGRNPPYDVTCRICGGDHPWQRCGND